MNRCWFLFFCFSAWACNETLKEKNVVVVSDSIIVAPNQIGTIARRPDVTEKQSGPSSVMDCDEALNRMFQTSNYRPDANLHLSDYRIHVSEPGDSALGIRIYHTHDNDSALMGILNFDLQTGKLIDLSPYLDSTVELKYDSSWLKIIRKQCGHLPPGLY